MLDGSFFFFFVRIIDAELMLDDKFFFFLFEDFSFFVLFLFIFGGDFLINRVLLYDIEMFLEAYVIAYVIRVLGRISFSSDVRSERE